jgi:dCTP deaminase
VLNDRQIREALATRELRIVPDPEDDPSIDDRIQPASLDVRLGMFFSTFDKARIGTIDPKKDQSDCLTRECVDIGGSFLVVPGELVLASTYERIGLGPTIAARIEGKSSLGRLGLMVHSTAGFVDPGWPLASITLEISAIGGLPVRLYPGMSIAQLAFTRIEHPDTTYEGKYVGQVGPTASKYHENWRGSW